MDTLQYIAPLDNSDARIACLVLAVLYIVACVVCAASLHEINEARKVRKWTSKKRLKKLVNGATNG